MLPDVRLSLVRTALKNQPPVMPRSILLTPGRPDPETIAKGITGAPPPRGNEASGRSELGMVNGTHTWT